MPRQRFRRPEDATEQLRRSVELHERLFNRRPVGLWPSEGSVSDEMVPLAAAAGFRWMATDELILARTLGTTFGRDGRGQINHPERLYAAYAVTSGSTSIACAFRDHVLSDLIGFEYASWPAERAAEDFVNRLVDAGRAFSARTGGEEAMIPVILDGENAWEHFPGGGRPFLRALYGRLARQPELRTVTMAEACARPRHRLESIFPGSWIDGNFYIWIGHADDQRAWGQLAEARDTLESAIGTEADSLARAGEEVLIAEGSDWFWWYGDDHSSAHDLEFDDLFRRHLRNVYTLLQKPIPDELFVSNISAAAPTDAETAPTALLSPTLDGEPTSYFEWLGAGVLEVRGVAGAMHRADQPARIVAVVQFGFDLEHFFLRVDGDRPMGDILAEGFELALLFLEPANVRYALSHAAGGGFFDRRVRDGTWIPRGTDGARLAVGTIVELAIPLAALALKPGAPVSFFVVVYDPSRREVERHPVYRPLDLRVPDRDFEARNWTA